MRLRLAILSFYAAGLLAQVAMTFQYFYDDTGQLVKVVDSTGVVIEYVYDAVGNMLQVKRSLVTPGSLSILSFTPQSAGPRSQVTIQGQGFSTILANNTVRFNGVAATILAATATTLVVEVPSGAASGPISVSVGATTAVSTANFAIAAVPLITSIIPHGAIANTTLVVTVTGINLTASTFAFLPAFVPPAITVGTVSINPAGTSATVSLTLGSNTFGRFALVAMNALGSSTALLTPANSFLVANPASIDADGDGLSDAQEVALGTSPFLPDTDGDGSADGVEVASASDPRNPACTPLNCRIAGGESNSVSFSAINTALPSGRFKEAETVTFSLLNTASPLGGFKEADSLTFSVCNNSLCPGFSSSSTEPAPILSLEPTFSGGSVNLGGSSAQPVVLAIIPRPNSTSIHPNTPVTLIFSEPMDPDSLDNDSLQLFAGGERIEAAVNISSDFRAVSLVPASLPVGTVITLASTKPLENVMGRAVAGFHSTFRTADGRGGPVIEQYPPNGAGDIPADASILMQSPKSAVVRVTQNGVPVSGAVRVDGDTTRFTPDVPLQAGAVVAVSMGNPDQYEGAFVVAGSHTKVLSPVRVSSGLGGSPGSRPVIEVEYNKPLDSGTINEDTISLRRGADDAPVPMAVALRGNRTIRIVPLESLMPETQYSYEISTGVRDVQGAPSATPLRRSIFILSPLTKPLSVVAIAPSFGTTDVTVTSPVRIKFSHPVNPLSVSGEMIQITSEATGAIPMAISFSDHFREVILKPLAGLPNGARIVITISGVEDGVGNVIVPIVTRFLTAPARSRRIAKPYDIQNVRRLAKAASKRR